MHLAELTSDLLASGNADGGWGAAPELPSNPEATALALAALTEARRSGHPVDPDPRDRALNWLRGAAARDGTFPFAADSPAAVWPTAVVAFALSGVPGARQDAVRAARALIGIKGRGNVWWVRLLGRLYPEEKAKAFDTDLDLTGWPWTRDTSSWVEPTAWAMLALRAMRGELPAHAVDERLRLGEAMLRDRCCPGGGWNYGNGRVLGQDLRPYPDTTALALLALRPTHPSPETTAALAALDRLLESNHSALAAALAALCIHAYGRDASAMAQRLEARYRLNGYRGDTRTLALATLATLRAARDARGTGA